MVYCFSQGRIFHGQLTPKCFKTDLSRDIGVIQQVKDREVAKGTIAVAETPTQGPIGTVETMI